MLERGPGGEVCPFPPLSFPSPRHCVPPDGDWQLQVPPGAPGTARQGSTRIIMLVNDGGTATQPRAPGHERPRAALRAARHGRLSAASTAPGADVPPATPAGAPGQYCLSAAPRAPGHGRPLAITAGVPGHDRLSAAPRAPAADAAPVTPAETPSQHRPSAAPIATVSLPAGQHRLRQEDLPRVPANPRTLTYSPAHQDTIHAHARYRRATRYTQSRASNNPPLSTMWRGAGGEARRPSPLSSGRPQTTHQAHPAIQVPPHPRPCSTAATGLSHHHPSRAPPSLAQPPKTYPCQTFLPSPTFGEGPGDGPKAHHTWHYPCGFGPSWGEARPVPRH